MSPDKSDAVFGLLNVNKPPGPTSHDVVALVRRGTGVRRVGHAGTLDPFASGVLVLCLGPATRLSEYAMQSSKQYRARLKLGESTDTYDCEGAVVARYEPLNVTLNDIEARLPAFRGDILQVPPMYSAIKQGGKKLYELARQGKEVERPARLVTIDRLTVLAYNPPFLTLDVQCSSGTYIRSLAHDLGQQLGAGAHLVALERAASGGFRIEDAVPLETLREAMAAGTWREYLLPPDSALADFPPLYLDEVDSQRVQNGNRIAAEAGAFASARAYDAAGRLLAILERQDDAWQPVKVFPPPA